MGTSSDTTCYLVFAENASGTAQQLKYDSGLTFNASTDETYFGGTIRRQSGASSANCGDNTYPWANTYTTTLYTDTINEKTTNNGVTIDGVSCLNSSITASGQDTYIVNKTGTQTISNNTKTLATFWSGSPSRDVGNITETGGLFSLNTNGTYIVSLYIGFQGNSTGYRRFEIKEYTSGEVFADTLISGQSSNSVINSLSAIIYRSSSTQIGVYVTQTSGGNLDLNWGKISITRVS